MLHQKKIDSLTALKTVAEERMQVLGAKAAAHSRFLTAAEAAQFDKCARDAKSYAIAIQHWSAVQSSFGPRP
ncbi:LAS superfamily LD-carboxypeptidase LdcB [Rhizobium azooxidifex]|uniref:LAS superfamily LD-carboxypeptidase LdcB n=1 Tax=Mycoplana azooxidifex TaxID=1636188 RepID=A0A7W6D797_9HYPH|nr:hypothetical protein [Mycoplana azooxidifex]MBB3978055.1 LAS superfamily LD-carboxypeptidase LdcB [Mycoplana azooxidifex]